MVGAAAAAAHMLRSTPLPWRNRATVRVIVMITTRQVSLVGTTKRWGPVSGHRAELWVSLPVGNNKRAMIWVWRHRSTAHHLIQWART